ncbi:hypothetical protein HDV06_006251 [Boothiomyces sp. JEL0866]|nr:hypothetical protein HDV06_006251 [Boothiomyces sp. JEL0866]
MPLITFEPTPITKGSLLDKLSKFFKRKPKVGKLVEIKETIVPPKKEIAKVDNFLNGIDRHSTPDTSKRCNKAIVKLDAGDYKSVVHLDRSRKSGDYQTSELQRRKTLVKLVPKEDLKRRGTVHDLPTRKNQDCSLQRRGTLIQLRQDEIKQPKKKTSIRRQAGKPLIELNK